MRVSLMKGNEQLHNPGLGSNVSSALISKLFTKETGSTILKKKCSDHPQYIAPSQTLFLTSATKKPGLWGRTNWKLTLSLPLLSGADKQGASPKDRPQGRRGHGISTNQIIIAGSTGTCLNVGRCTEDFCVRLRVTPPPSHQPLESTTWRPGVCVHKAIQKPQEVLFILLDF